MMLLLMIITLIPMKNTGICNAYRDSVQNMLPSLIQRYGEIDLHLKGAFRGESIAFIDNEMDSLMTVEGYMFGVRAGHHRVYVHPRRFSSILLPDRRYLKVFSDYRIAYAHDPTTFCIYSVEVK